MLRKSKNSDYEQKEFEVVSADLKKRPGLGVFFLLLTLIFAGSMMLVPPMFIVIVIVPISLLNLILLVAAGVCLTESILMFKGTQTVKCPYCGATYYLSPKNKKLSCRQCKKKSFRG